MRHAGKLLRTGLAGLFASASFVAFGAHAQSTAAQADGQTGIETVIVTARRQAENIQRTPIAVTALSGATLAKKNIVNLTNLQGSVPSLSILVGSPAGSGYAIVSIRGQAQYNNNVAGDPAVGVYVDGVYIARPSASTLDLLDIDHVEVLRGPQGTLFGRNTVGGAVTITTKQPNGEFGGLISAEAGNYSENRETAVLNVPIIGDQLDLRMDYVHAEHGGYGRDITLNRPAGDLHENFGRAQLRFAPDNAHWNLTLEGDWFANDDSGQQVVLRAANPKNPFVGHTLDAYVQTNANFYNDFGGTIALFGGGSSVPFDHQTAQGYSAIFNADLGWAKFKSITAYHGNTSIAKIDLDGTPVNLLENNTLNVASNISQEFQLNGGTGNLSWITGFYYFREKGMNLGYARQFGLLRPSDPQARLGKSLANVVNTSTAAYAQIYYKFTDKLRGYGGLRYTWDERAADVGNANASGTIVFTGIPAIDDALVCSPTSLANPALPFNAVTNPCDHHSDAKFSYPSYSVGLDYQATPNLFLYTSFNTAYMSGFQNVRVATVPAVKPEGDMAFEVGVKSDWLDHRLRINADVFHTWQNNVQRQINTVLCSPCISTSFSVNAGKAQVTGAEFEVTAVPWTGMEINGGLGVMNGGYVKGTFLDNQTVVAAVNPNPGPCVPAPTAGQFFCAFDRSSEPLPQFPKLTFNIGATQTIPVSVGLLTLHMDYSYISSQHYTGITAAPEQPPAVAAQYVAEELLNILPAHGELNAQVSLDIGSTGVRLALWGKNITGTKYLADNFDSYVGLGIIDAEPGPPATFGGTITYRFGHQ